MADYLKLFENQSDYELAKETDGLKKPRVDYIEESREVIYTPLTATDLMEMLEGVYHYDYYDFSQEYAQNVTDQITRYNDSAYYYNMGGSSSGTSISFKFKESFNINSINFHIIYIGDRDGSEKYIIDEAENSLICQGGESIGGSVQVIIFISDLAIPEEISSIDTMGDYITTILERPDIQNLLVKYKNNIFIKTGI